MTTIQPVWLSYTLPPPFRSGIPGVLRFGFTGSNRLRPEDNCGHGKTNQGRQN